MILSKITGRHVKGGDFSYILGPATVFTGDNDAGKTRILDAIQLALLGYVPALGKQNASTAQLMDGAEMIIEAEITDGLVVYALRRRWYLSGNSVKTDFAIPGALQDKIADAPLAVMLSSSAYFALDPIERVRYVAAHCPAEGISNAALVKRVCDVLPEESGECKPMRRAQITVEGATFSEKESSVFVDRLLEVMANLWKGAKSELQRKEGEIQSGAQRRAATPTGPIRHEDDILADRATSTRAINELSEVKGRLIGEYSAMKNAGKRREQIRVDVAALKKDNDFIPPLTAKHADLAIKLAALPDISEQDVVEASDALRSAIYNRDTLLRLGQEATQSQLTCEREIAHMAAETACPYCGTSGENWKAKKLADLQRDRVAFKSLADQHAAGIPGAEQLVTRFKDAQKRAADGRLLHQQVANALKSVAEELARLSPNAARALALTEEMDKLTPDDPGLSNRMDTIQGEINLLTESIRKLDGELAASASRARDKERLAQAERDRDRAKEDMEAWKLVGEELKKVQAELVEAAFKPLLQLANAVFPGLLKTPLAFRDGEVGRWQDGTWVSNKVFGGAAQKLAFAAIQAALAARSPIRIMLIDEMGNFADKTAVRVTQAVEEAIAAGRLDQFVGIDPGRGSLYELAESQFQVIEVK